MNQIHIIIEGHVQGVCFRTFVQTQAKILGLVGYVKNTDDKVEILAQGSEENLNKLLAECNKGPENANITNCKHNLEPIQEDFKHFSIKY